MRRCIRIICLLVLSACALFAFLSRAGGAAGPDRYEPLPKPGEKVALGSGHYFTYEFQRPPKLGAAILKVQVFTRTGQPDMSLTVYGRADMPSMWGTHSTSFRDLKVTKKGDYILPMDLTMPGEWEVRLIFLKNGKVIFRGSHRFSV